jgi:hypothetical protein
VTVQSHAKEYGGSLSAVCSDGSANSSGAEVNIPPYAFVKYWECEGETGSQVLSVCKGLKWQAGDERVCSQADSLVLHGL